MESIVLLITSVLLAPFFSAIILKVKAFFGGKKGPSLFFNYSTLIKLFKKGSVYSNSTTFVFKLGPVISFSAAATVLLFFPFAGVSPVFAFHGDVIALFYLLAIGRFFTILAALDTASPFEGMGAARETYFSALAETTIFMVLILFYRLSSHLSFAAYFTGESGLQLWNTAGAVLILIVIALFFILLTENSRVPVDDPATHLELTMIHEVMVLDHSGPDLAFIQMGVFMKLLFYASLISSLIFPFTIANSYLNVLVFYLVLIIVYIFVGITESFTARFKMNMVPSFILISFALAFFSAVLTLELI